MQTAQEFGLRQAALARTTPSSGGQFAARNYLQWDFEECEANVLQHVSRLMMSRLEQHIDRPRIIQPTDRNVILERLWTKRMQSEEQPLTEPALKVLEWHTITRVAQLMTALTSHHSGLTVNHEFERWIDTAAQYCLTAPPSLRHPQRVDVEEVLQRTESWRGVTWAYFQADPPRYAAMWRGLSNRYLDPDYIEQLIRRDANQQLKFASDDLVAYSAQARQSFAELCEEAIAEFKDYCDSTDGR
ncbi:MAG TPA: hypothetical protein VLI05_01400 [Candidatus Saccharimonadia bacterium]|nr:hypothetical protein [Candidatus Saccharimonadia bacterium]